MNDELRTPRLRLRPYEEEDLGHLLALRSCPAVWIHSTNQADPTEAGARQALDRLLSQYPQGWGPWALWTTDGRYVGEAGQYAYHAVHGRTNVGYNLLPEFWGRGYATEITRALVGDCFARHPVHRVEATVLAENRASRRVLEKSGFALEGTLRQFVVIGDRPRDLCYYAILR